MNQQDRAKVAELQTKLEELKSQVEAIGSEFREMADAEQEKFDQTERGKYELIAAYGPNGEIVKGEGWDIVRSV